MKRPLQTLVVDDEAQLRAFVSMALRDDGWEVSEAESAEQAVEMLHDQDWSAVFCDVMLGGADGFSVLRRFQGRIARGGGQIWFCNARC
jgi:DNA-binding response OmpR family regulator